MINMSYLEYIIENKRDSGYNDILVDIYVSYYGGKPTENQKNTCIDGYMFNFSKHNLRKIDVSIIPYQIYNIQFTLGFNYIH